VAQRLCDLLNRGVTPVVPSLGSVGASGDLAPLAHMALVLIGEGEAEYEGAVYPGADALRRASLEPLTLRAKEGISLINGTQAMLAIGCLELTAAESPGRLRRRHLCHDPWTPCAATPRAFDARLHAARPHGRPGGKRRAAAAAVGRQRNPAVAYYLPGACRTLIHCAARRRLHGAVRDSLAEARRVFAIELNSATDNPAGARRRDYLRGQFPWRAAGLPVDYLAVALTALSGIASGVSTGW